MLRSLKVRSSKKDFVESKIRKQYPTAGLEAIAGFLTTTKDTLIKFRKGQPVKTQLFHKFCDHFNIDWREVVAKFHPVKLPHPGAELFLGRSQEIQELHSLISKESSVVITQVLGMGGVGKSELIRQYAHTQLDEETTAFPGGILHINARSSKEQIAQEIINFVDEVIGIAVPKKPQRGSNVYTVMDRAAWCFGNWEPEGDVLLILDDVTDFETISPLREVLPARFKVVVTTRLKNLGAGFKKLEIDIFKPDISLELLLGLSGRKVFTSHEAELEKAKEICTWLGHLPLAVELVGRYLSIHEGLTFNEMFTRLEQKRIQQKALIDSHPGMTASRNVTAAFDLSFDDLSHDERRLAFMLSMFAVAPVPWDAVDECLRDLPEYVSDLRDYGLVNRNLLKFIDTDLYQMHELIREYFQMKLKDLSTEEATTRSAPLPIWMNGETMSERYGLEVTVICWEDDESMDDDPTMEQPDLSPEFDYELMQIDYVQGLRIAATNLVKQVATEFRPGSFSLLLPHLSESYDLLLRDLWTDDLNSINILMFDVFALLGKQKDFTTKLEAALADRSKDNPNLSVVVFTISTYAMLAEIYLKLENYSKAESAIRTGIDASLSLEVANRLEYQLLKILAPTLNVLIQMKEPEALIISAFAFIEHLIEKHEVLDFSYDISPVNGILDTLVILAKEVRARNLRSQLELKTLAITNRIADEHSGRMRFTAYEQLASIYECFDRYEEAESIMIAAIEAAVSVPENPAIAYSAMIDLLIKHGATRKTIEEWEDEMEAEIDLFFNDPDLPELEEEKFYTPPDVIHFMSRLILPETPDTPYLEQ